MKIALLPGGFKPPHLGHYNMAKYLADFADDVIVRIGRKERDGIGPELALEIFNYYKAADPDPRAQKLTISIASHPSPVKDVYDFVEQIAPEGSELVLGMGEKDAQDGRYNSIPKFAEPRNIKSEIKLVPPQAGGISGTRMREIIKANDKDTFFKYIPEFLPEEIKEEIWTKLIDTTMPSDIEEMMGGTMNREEMAKHMANMKKLRKFFSKQSDQMVQVPTKLTKGLRRKLYEVGEGSSKPFTYKKFHFGAFDKFLDKFSNILPSDKGGFIYKIEAYTESEGKKEIIPIELLGHYGDKAYYKSINYSDKEIKNLIQLLGDNFKNLNIHFTIDENNREYDLVNDRVYMFRLMATIREILLKEIKTTKLNSISFQPTKRDSEDLADNMNTGRFKLYDVFIKKAFPGAQAHSIGQGIFYPISSPTALNEGRYDEEVLKQSRFVINKFKEEFGKEFKGESDKSYIGWLKGTPTQKKKPKEFQLSYKLDLEFVPDKDLELMPFDIYANAGPNSIYVKIVYNPDSFPEAYNKLIYEVKDAIRHELEHVGQYEFDKDAYPEGEDLEGFDYFTAEEEIPAFVQGLYKQAKTRKLPLSQVFDEFLADRSAELTDKEEELIKLIWTDYAKQNLPAAQLDEGDPKVGTGKKPKGSGRRLYTDEDPTDTVSVKFSSRQDIVDTLSKKSFKSKSHARQSQIINLIHQRVRAAYNRAKDPDVKKRLKIALDYAEKRKEASKKKTQQLKKENFPPYKANQVQQVRYKASDTFTNDRKKAKKLGYLEEAGIDREELKKGIEVEKEHTDDLRIAMKIALDHLAEDPKYYTKLATLGLEEMKLFSKDWWMDIISETLLNEGGAAGHMAHPFDLPNVNTGKDLIKSFEQAADSLKKTPGSVKIDGVNASIRLVNFDGKREFAMDRGSKKALDLKGVTKADLEDRFGPGHGMIKAGGDVLDIFNDAMDTIQPELEALGMWDDPNIMFNMEYVSGKSNVQDYGKNFLAIHGLLNVETKEIQGARQMLVKRVTSEKGFNQSDMDNLLKKLESFAKKKGFEIYGSVPTRFTKDPDFKSVLNKRYTIDTAEGDQTKTLAQWLDGVTNIPKTDRLKMNIEETDSIKDVGALSKQVYFAVFGGENVDSLFSNEQEVNKAIQGATTYLATEKLGDAILDVLDSPMGSVNDHEGVVIRDEKISNRPFKITGKFITGGVSSQFQTK